MSLDKLSSPAQQCEIDATACQRAETVHWHLRSSTALPKRPAQHKY